MKRYSVAMLIIAGAVTMCLLAMPGRALTLKIDREAVKFDEPVKLLDVILKGEYLFVHDEEKMSRGEACTYVYKYTDGKQGELVASFHCIPVEREKANNFTITVTTMPGMALLELTEFKFTGSVEGHRISQGK
jgi:hypothetical protein